jgi:hypothetical protein
MPVKSSRRTVRFCGEVDTRDWPRASTGVKANSVKNFFMVR